MTQDPKQIAAGLSEAQRELCLASDLDEWDGRGFGVELHGVAVASARVLERKRLGWIEETPGHCQFGLYFNDALGIAVRNILKENEDENG